MEKYYRISYSCGCGKCGLIWYEYFKITYDGYSYKGEGYAADGGRLW